MAVPHFSISIVSSGDGRSVVLSAAYRHCAKMDYEREARSVDYTRKQGLRYEAFSTPPDAPYWLRGLITDRSVAGASEAFWNKVEAFEKRSDAQLAKDITIALPLELSVEQNITLVSDFVEQHILANGMVADWVYHDAPGNPHVHLMTTLRPLAEDGFGPKKVPVIDDNGKVVRTKAGKIVYELWAGGRGDFMTLRNAWFETQNRHLSLGGIDLRVDGRSYAARGIDLVPTSHIGVGAKAIQRKSAGERRELSLERIDVLEARRKENVSRILRRPEIVLDVISSEKSVFDERDIAKILHRYVDEAAMFQHLMLRILQSPEALRIERDGIDLASGARIRSRFTTRELIRIEARMAKQSLWLSRRPTHGVQGKVLDCVLSRHSRLSQEQRVAIAHVAKEGRIAAVVGRAGTGKTTLMTAAREAWELAGYRVVGAALAGKAAEGLETEAGIVSRSLASWELRWKQGRDMLDNRTVFVLDEAGMVGSKQMALVVEAATKAAAKLVLIGDPEQLQPIEAGGAFRAVVDLIGYAELETIYRQREAWMRAASLDLARGRVVRALGLYRQHGRVCGSELKAQAIDSLIADWNRDYDPTKTTLILAHLRRDVWELNRHARTKLVERGIVGVGHAFRTEDGLRQFDTGDQIVFLKNETSLGVKNGMIGQIVEAAPSRIVAAIGKGKHRRLVTVEQRFYPYIDHGYATTIHKSQGSTVDQVKVLASLSLDRHLAYVALTRHRQDLALYYGRRSFAKMGGLEKVLSRTNTKETTLDYERGTLYRQALRFAENRGLRISRVARTLVRDRLDWALRQKERLADLVWRLRVSGERLGLFQPSMHIRKDAEPMVAGVTLFAISLEDVVEQRLLIEPVLAKLWEEVSTRFRYVFADPETALRTMDFAAVLANPTSAEQTLARLVCEPVSIGALKGRTGLLASRADKEARRIAELNLPALKRDVECYLRQRRLAAEKIEDEEQARRRRVSIAIPALSAAAGAALEKIHEAIDRIDFPAVVDRVLGDHKTKLEINNFNRAIAERFGERTLLSSSAREPSGTLFDKAAESLPPSAREKLREAWQVMRAAQWLAEHERTTQTLKQTEHLRLTSRQGMAWTQ
ncbi:Ti-type conjugative transfer relaxase TraA [Aminobacter sp. MET-1]|uniref:Ti-type conjugative transfer relaxase TraA n=1 Tax=Aminobacter sp. MET-1 TaxID=2951085 RepID=UPI00226A9E25|nr:Ti-type conjugative transfer relaxase TraA [Aminobacter sp. MET-1]MCX8570809.1 Ti-type conjugative transfer relaxase TraA [Aminobacter sp. MET-1]